MRVAAVLGGEAALAQCVVVARVLLEVVAEPTFSSHGAEVLIVKFFAGVLGGLWSSDLSTDVVGEVAVEAVLAVPSEVVDAGVVASLHMALSAFGGVLAFVYGEVLLGAETDDPA